MLSALLLNRKEQDPQASVKKTLMSGLSSPSSVSLSISQEVNESLGIALGSEFLNSHRSSIVPLKQSQMMRKT